MTINNKSSRTPIMNITISHIIYAFGIGLSIFVLVTMIFVFAFQFKYLGKIYPGVTVQDVDLSAMNFEQAITAIEEYINYSSTSSITFDDKEKNWQFSPLDLGLFLDSEGIYLDAIDVGRQGSWIEQLKDQFNSYRYGVHISPQYVFDERLAQLRIAPISEEINLEMIEASLVLDNNGINMQNGQIGRILNVHEAVSLLKNQLKYQNTISFDLPITEYYPAIIDVTHQAETIEVILNQDLKLTLPSEFENLGGPWIIDQEALISMLVVELASDDNGSEYVIKLDETELLYHLTTISDEINTTPINSRFYFDDDTRELVLVESSINGLEINKELSLGRIQAELKNESHVIDLVVDQVIPDVVDTSTAAELGITELVSAQTSFFYGSSSGRIQNIQTASLRFYGLLIPPGGTFSMVENIGEITLDTGFAEALIIYNGRTVKGVGGGVCQVSTTLFRTVFFGGFPVVDRYPHLLHLLLFYHCR